MFKKIRNTISTKFANLPIKSKILRPTMVSFLLLSVFFGSAIGLQVVRILTQIAQDRVITVADLRANQISSFIDHRTENLQEIARLPVYQDLLLTSQEEEVYKDRFSAAQAMSSHNLSKDIINVVIADQSGKEIIAADSKAIDYDLENIIKQIPLDGVYIGKERFSEVLAKPVIELAIVIKDQDQRPLGYLVNTVDLTEIFKIVSNHTGLGQTGEALLINRDRVLLTSSSVRQLKFFVDKIDSVLVRECVGLSENENSGQSTTHRKSMHFNDYRQQKVIGTYVHFTNTNWCLIAKIDQNEVFQPSRLPLLLSLLAATAYLLIFFLISNWISRKITQPLIQLEKGVRVVEQGNFGYQVGLEQTDEIGRISKAFDRMIKTANLSKQEIEAKVRQQTLTLSSHVKDEENQRKAILNILDDVEQEKNKSQNLANDLEKFRLAVQNASDHIVITDPDGNILYANEAVKKITGFDPKNIVGMKAGCKELWGGLMEKDDYEKFWHIVKEEKKPYNGEFRNRRKNGQIYIASVHVSPILDEKKNVRFFVGIERDITREREVDRMKTEFISLASHQLRTPLSAIKWFLELLISGDVGKLSKEQLDAVKNINASNNRMIELINALLNISRIESGRIIIEPKPTDLNQLMKEVIAELQPRIKDKSLDLTFKPTRLPKIKVDPKLIREAYKNILTNAIKYSIKKGQIKIAIYPEKTKLVAEIADQGLGIPEPEQEKIFSKFFRGTNVVKLETDGTGLGLYLTKAIVESSQGEIHFKSQEKKGTTFWIGLPIKGSSKKKGEVSIDTSI